MKNPIFKNPFFINEMFRLSGFINTKRVYGMYYTVRKHFTQENERGIIRIAGNFQLFLRRALTSSTITVVTVAKMMPALTHGLYAAVDESTTASVLPIMIILAQ